LDVIVTGASGAIPRHDIERMTSHAKMFYKAIRSRKSHSDVVAIAANTGFSQEDIYNIKMHLFINKYAGLDDEDPHIAKRFDEDYDIAQSWQRLINGGQDIREMDIILLYHERMEYELMHQGLGYYNAHAQAARQFNYGKYVDELNMQEGIK